MTIDNQVFGQPLKLALFTPTPTMTTADKLSSPLNAGLSEAFETATGWVLGFEESKSSHRRRQKPGLADSPATGRVSIHDMAELPAGTRPSHRGKCDSLAQAINLVLQELQQAKLELSKAQSALAVHDSNSLAVDRHEKFSELLPCLLNSSIQFAGGDKACMYTLDEETQWLEMRCSTGMDNAHLKSDRRSLESATADLAALSGSAVVLTDLQQVECWNVPVNCQSAVCIPIASSTNILGTLWVFSDHAKEYSDEKLNILEIIAGRIAAEMECQIILKKKSTELAYAPEAAEALVDKISEDFDTLEMLEPVVDPPFEGWAMLGNCGARNGCFIDWSVTDCEQIEIMFGKAAAKSDDKAPFDHYKGTALRIDPFTAEYSLVSEIEEVHFWHVSNGNITALRECTGLARFVPGEYLVVTASSDESSVQRFLDSIDHGAVDELAMALVKK